ncbi:MAG: hypothetical protein M1838_001993 [Thelocarpon superellum]|nr:MAG: hypothetical protein M1838_001993 [Thelocarpon superellum]
MSTENAPSHKDAGDGHVPQWIDNEAVVTREALHFRVESTATEQVWTASGADEAVARHAVDSAAAAFPAWSQTQPWHRRRLLMKAAEMVRARRELLVATMMAETNASHNWASGLNLEMAADFIEELACLAASSAVGWLPPTNSPDRMALVLKEPYGVVLGVAPWNAPFFLAVRAVITPIACGNTAVLKGSELSPRTHHLLGEVLKDAGFPPGVLNIIQASRTQAPEVMKTLIAHPAVRKVNFTGSTAVGKIVAQQAGLYLKPVLLELGGKAPLIVLDDADLDKAAQAAVVGAFLHHGQICMATERVVVMSTVLSAFTERLRHFAATFDAGTAASHESAVRASALVSSALAAGARLVFGRNERRGAKLDATILTDVKPGVDLYGEESFGPTLTIIPVASVDEAVEVANDTAYGLSASIFSRDVMKAVQLARRLDTGACHVNAMTVHDEPSLPHGGSKASGSGRFGAQWGMDEFLQIKTVTVTATADG